MNKRIDTWLPVILFLLIGICIFLTERRDGGAIDGSISDSTSAHGITLSKNLMNSEHLLFMYSSREIHRGKTDYEAYNRFPVFPFLLTGILIYPFEHDLSMQIYLARQLMNLFFLLSIIIVYKLVSELSKNKYLALSITLIAFSSYYILSYHNMIFNDIPALLGFVAAIHCIVISSKTQLKTSQIFFYSIFPVSLGWQPYAVYAAWFLLDSLESLLKKKISYRYKILTIIKQPSFIIMALAIAWGILILGLQLLNEWRIVGGSFIDLPSVSSGLWKSSLTSAKGHTTLVWAYDWLTYLPSQFHIMTIMLLPFWPIFQIEPGLNASVVIVLSAIIYALFKYFKEKSPVNKTALIMIVSGLFWTIPMRHFVALHDFQSVFYIGFPVGVYLIFLSKIKLQAWNLLAVNLTIVFLISFALSNFYKTPYSSVTTNQLKIINERLPAKSKVYYDGDRQHMKGFSRFAVEIHLIDCFFTERNEADYILSENPDFEGEKLTSNSRFNLFKNLKSN